MFLKVKESRYAIMFKHAQGSGYDLPRHRVSDIFAHLDDTVFDPRSSIVNSVLDCHYPYDECVCSRNQDDVMPFQVLTNRHLI